MSSSSSNQTNISVRAAEEHLSNFQQLPFHIYFTNPYSPLPPILTTLNFSNFFRQISSGITPISPPPQRLILVEAEYHYRYIIDRRPRVQDHQRIPSTSSSSDSFSSLPDLIPIQDNSNISSNLVINQNTTSPHIEPPPYADSTDRPPAYHTIRSRELVLRRIRILERNTFEVRQEIIEEHHRNISRITSETERRSDTHDSVIREKIDIL